MAPDLYLDANATSPVLPSAIAAAVEAMEASFGNPSSSHATGLRAKRILDTTRARARRVLGAGPGRVLFTSGATEGIQTAVLSALVAVRDRRADVALGPRPPAGGTPPLESTPFLRFSLAVVAAPERARRLRSPVTAAQLAGQPWLLGP